MVCFGIDDVWKSTISYGMNDDIGIGQNRLITNLGKIYTTIDRQDKIEYECYSHTEYDEYDSCR